MSVAHFIFLRRGSLLHIKFFTREKVIANSQLTIYPIGYIIDFVSVIPLLKEVKNGVSNFRYNDCIIYLI